MKIDLELKNKIKELIINSNKYLRTEDILEMLNIKEGRVYLSYRGINTTLINKECGFIRREKSKRIISKKPSLSKDEVIDKIKRSILIENRYVHRNELHSKYKIWSDTLTYYDIDTHFINIEMGYYKDTPQSKINKRKLYEDIKEYIIREDRYICQQEIVDVFKVSLGFLTQGPIDTILLNSELGFYNDSSYFENKVLNVLRKYYTYIVTEKTFKDCRSEKGHLLRFDFFIENKLLLEADGSQHWNTSHRFYSDSGIINDTIKNKYVLENRIPLIRIPYSGRYTEENYIEQVLLESLKSLVTTTGLEITNVKVRKALGLDNQQPSS